MSGSVKYLFLLFFSSSALFSSSQKVLLHRKSSSVLQRNETAQSMSNAGRWFYTRSTLLGSVVPTPISGDIGMSYAGCFFFGNDHRFTRSISRHLSWGWGLGFQLLTYGIRQQKNNALSNQVLYKRQSLNTYALPVDIFIRQHFTQKSNTLGWYLDLGWKGCWNFYQLLVSQEELDPKVNQGVGRRYIYNSRLDYVSRWAQFGVFRMGRGHVAVGVMHRFTHFFRTSNSIYAGKLLPDLPRWIGTIEFTFWNRNKSAKKDEDEL